MEAFFYDGMDGGGCGSFETTSDKRGDLLEIYLRVPTRQTSDQEGS